MENLVTSCKSRLVTSGRAACAPGRRLAIDKGGAQSTVLVWGLSCPSAGGGDAVLRARFCPLNSYRQLFEWAATARRGKEQKAKGRCHRSMARGKYRRERKKSSCSLSVVAASAAAAALRIDSRTGRRRLPPVRGVYDIHGIDSYKS
jgi:hypothetical protein